MASNLPGPQTQNLASVGGNIPTPYGPVNPDTFARLVERVGVLILLGWVLHLVLTGMTGTIAVELRGINVSLAEIANNTGDYSHAAND